MRQSPRHIYETIPQETPSEVFVHPENSLPTETAHAENNRLETILKEIENSDTHFSIFDIRPQSNDIGDWDNFLDTLVKAHKTYPNAVEKVLSITLQDGQMFTPDKLITTLMSLFASGEISNYLKTSILHGLNYLISFYPTLYTETFLKHLDFDNPEKFAETGSFLEMLKSLFLVGGDWSFSEDTVPFVIRATLIDALEKRKGSYLLTLRCQELVELMEHDGDAVHHHEDTFPFEVSPGVFGLHENNKLFVSQENSVPTILELTSRVSQLQKTMHVDRHARLEAHEKYRDLLSLVSTPIETMLEADSQKKTPEDVRDYAYILTRPIREKIKQEFDVDITRLPLLEQFHFAQFLKTVAIENAEIVKTFTKTYGESGARVFLSLEEHGQLGNEIVELGASLPQALAEKIFERYGKLIDASRTAGNYILDTFGTNTPTDISHAVTTQLMVRANNLLLQAIKESKDETNQTILASHIETALEHADANISLFTATCKAFDAQGESIDLRDIKDVVFDRFTQHELSAEDIESMRSIYTKNYEQTPGIQHDLLKKFDAVVSKQSDTAWHPVHFYTLKHRGAVVAFCSFTDSDNGLTFGMMNVDSKYQRSAVGQMFLDATIGIESQWANIEASCNAHGPAARHYIENGFIGTHTSSYHEDLALDIIFRSSTGGTLSEKEIIDTAVSPETISPHNSIITLATTAAEEIPFDLLNQGFVLSRYFKKGNHYYTVFEKPQKADSSAIIV